jgi:hypothetical protein
MMMGGHPLAGARAWGMGMLQRTAMRSVTNLAGMVWDRVKDAGIGNLIGGQERNGELTWLGKLLQGTPFGMDQSRLAGHAHSTLDPLKDNTSAEEANTAMLRTLDETIKQLIASLTSHGGTVISRPGVGGIGGFGHFPMTGWSGLSFGGGGIPSVGRGGLRDATYSRVNFGEGWIGNPSFSPPALPMLEGAGGVDLANLPMIGPSAFSTLNPFMTESDVAIQQLAGLPVSAPAYNPLDPFSGMAGVSSKGSQGATMRAIGKAAGVAAAAYGVYSGVRTGGVRGGLSAGASALAGASLFAGPAAPFLAAAALGMGMATMFIPDPRAARARQIAETIDHARYIDPTPQYYTYTKYGQEAYFQTSGGAGPSNVNVTIQALDARSLVDRSVDIANVVAQAVESRQSPRLNAGIRSLAR